MLDHLTTRQKQALAGGIVLALGMALGVVIAPDDPQRVDRLADLGSAVDAGSALAASDRVDAAEYHRAISAVRATRPDVTDLLTAPVEPGELVTTEVTVGLGVRVVEVELVAPAAGRFATLSIEHVDREADTLVRISASNTSDRRLRFVALARCSSACAVPVGAPSE